MKKSVLMILLISLFILPFSGCKASSPSTENNPTTTTQTAVHMQTVYLPLTETYTYSTGETKTVEYLYDANFHLTGVSHGIGPNGEELICSAVCDDYGRVTEIHHAGVGGESHTITYDEFWRIATFESKFLGNTDTSVYSYSPDGYLEKLSFSYGGYELYSYENGLLTETAIYNANGEIQTQITCTYDNQGRIISRQQCSTGCEPQTTTYSYSDDGLTYTYEFGGATHTDSFDTNGNLIHKSFTSSFFSYECVYTYLAIEIPAHLKWIPYQDNFCN